MALFLGEHADPGVSFMEGTLMTGFEKRWQVRTFVFLLFRRAQGHKPLGDFLVRNRGHEAIKPEARAVPWARNNSPPCGGAVLKLLLSSKSGRRILMRMSAARLSMPGEL